MRAGCQRRLGLFLGADRGDDNPRAIVSRKADGVLRDRACSAGDENRLLFHRPVGEDRAMGGERRNGQARLLPRN